MRLVIAHAEDLEQAERLVSWFGRPGLDEVRATLSWLDREQQERIAQTLETQIDNCGYAWGIPALLMALGWCFYWLPWSVAPARAAVVTVALSSVTALAARTAGVAWCRWRVKVLLRRVSSPLSTDQIKS